MYVVLFSVTEYYCVSLSVTVSLNSVTVYQVGGGVRLGHRAEV